MKSWNITRMLLVYKITLFFFSSFSSLLCPPKSHLGCCQWRKYKDKMLLLPITFFPLLLNHGFVNLQCFVKQYAFPETFQFYYLQKKKKNRIINKSLLNLHLSRSAGNYSKAKNDSTPYTRWLLQLYIWTGVLLFSLVKYSHHTNPIIWKVVWYLLDLNPLTQLQEYFTFHFSGYYMVRECSKEQFTLRWLAVFTWKKIIMHIYTKHLLACKELQSELLLDTSVYAFNSFQNRFWL